MQTTWNSGHTPPYWMKGKTRSGWTSISNFQEARGCALRMDTPWRWTALGMPCVKFRLRTRARMSSNKLCMVCQQNGQCLSPEHNQLHLQRRSINTLSDNMSSRIEHSSIAARGEFRTSRLCISLGYFSRSTSDSRRGFCIETDRRAR